VASSLQGADQLQARLKALRKDVFKPAARLWADEAVKVARASVPNRDTRYSKGKLHDSIRRKSATQQKAVVVGFYTGYFVDAGVRPHSLKRGRTKPGRTIFSSSARKGHPGYRARPWRGHATAVALQRHPVLDQVILAWNKAA
jgi:hypothetical protein